MKPHELKIMREYKKLQTEVENTIMTDINDKVSELLDKRCAEKYELAQKVTKEALEGIAPALKELNGVNYKNYIRALENFFDKAEAIKNYMGYENELAKEVKELVEPFIKPKMDEIEELILGTSYINLHQVSRNMFLQMQMLNKNINYLLVQIINQTLTTYKDIIYEEFTKVLEMSRKVDQKFDEIVDKKISDFEKMEKFKTQKIFDHKKLDKLIKDLGYQATRQTGSHKIYENEQGKSVPVPQHSRDLGKGLSMKIQKQINITI